MQWVEHPLSPGECPAKLQQFFACNIKEEFRPSPLIGHERTLGYQTAARKPPYRVWQRVRRPSYAWADEIAYLAQVVLFADDNPVVSEDVVGRHDVEVEVRQ
jgi:hypothetical protein